MQNKYGTAGTQPLMKAVFNVVPEETCAAAYQGRGIFLPRFVGEQIITRWGGDRAGDYEMVALALSSRPAVAFRGLGASPLGVRPTDGQRG